VHKQNPERIYERFERFVRELVGDMATVEFKRFGSGLPFRERLENPYVQAGLKALMAGFGKPAIGMWMGGSIPMVAPLVAVTDAPCVLMGFGLPGDNLHAPNENFPLSCFMGGARSAAAYLSEVGLLAGTLAKK
jgi:acetylornithine deacetylase/succinyl-diaminopimelate desuccinylase-like protein